GVGIYKFERSSKADSQVLTPWAVKKLLNGRSETIIDERLHFEAEILRQLDHPNVIGFRAFIKGVDGKPCLAMEALDTSLGDKIEERREESFGKKPFSPESIMRVGFETIKGVEYLHHNVHILHGDIKSWNILVTHDLNTIKLGDFGNSLPLTKSLKLDTSKGDFSYVGTRPWNPPEIIFENGPVTGAADIWSYGLVLWEMLTLSSPHCKDLSDEFSSDESSNDESSSDKSEASMNKSETFRKREKYSEFGTRPAVSNIDLGKDYERVLEIFFACTTNCYLLRPRAKALVNYYKKYININKRLL
ncbi:Lymphokine-activated killer T-cell-originated protein kinase, partial [Cyphomyrmex costatus]